ncbi:MAG TPA: glycerol-3-phosphate dehydrogenase/oxidase [Pirellulales bacterium]|jgi:glycerol-3-phosphate dehydrogenase|nr:glycerol-3-phosphate dehydrogenase/oxidase [Pirellulales bacterium]
MPAPIVILGAGINGAALARELVLNGLPVLVIERRDIASGTTAYSSRLIHGGLRYLEYGEFDLVRESLGERTRWLQLAPHLVRPLELMIPVGNWFGGFWSAARTFFRIPKRRAAKHLSRPRGLATVRAGLWLYDRYARDRQLRASHVLRAGNPTAIPVDQSRYRWLCSYMDAQVLYPERLTVEMLQDARRLAEQNGVEFRVLTYHEAALAGSQVAIRSLRTAATGVELIEPAAVINATGAWVDRTLATLKISAERLIGGTKGSHFLTHQSNLRKKLNGRALYLEAADGRPVFILPFASGTLVGTTDEPFSGDPAQALATEVELDYLIGAVNAALPDVRLTRADLALHYCGVRPLPYTSAGSTAAITRRHALHEHRDASLPLFSVIGGKLTTCRSLAEESVQRVLARLGQSPQRNSRTRPIPGGADYPSTAAELAAEAAQFAARHGLTRAQGAALWSLFGSQCRQFPPEFATAANARENLTGTDLPRAMVGWVLREEWAKTLEDLVERRLMLLYHQRLSRTVLYELAEDLIRAECLFPDDRESAVQDYAIRLSTHFGRNLS